MKILLITFGDINTPNNGYLIRVSMIYSCLNRSYEVSVVQFANTKESKTDRNIMTFRAGKNYLSLGIRLIFKALSSVKLTKTSDIVIVEGSMFLPFIIVAKILRKRVIYDTHGSIVEVSKGLKGLKNLILRRLLGRLLDSISTKLSDIVITVSENDSEIFKKYTRNKNKIIIVRHGIDVNKIPFYEVSNEKIKRAIFVGNLYSIQNYEAVRILLKVAENVKDVEFLVVGDGKERFKDHPPNVKFTGKVHSLDEYYKEADVCFIPLTTGTGIKTKVLECMAYGRPVITTKKGIEGLIDAEKLNGVYLVKDAANVEEYVKLLNLIKLERSYMNLREYVDKNYSTNIICEKLLYILNLMLSQA